MRLFIQHRIVFSYATPAYAAIQALRMTPRSYNGQFVRDWRIDVSEDSRLIPFNDAFGNILHTISVEGPLDQLEIAATGEVELDDRSGLVSDAAERMPEGIYLRESGLTKPSVSLQNWIEERKAELKPDLSTIERVHAFNAAVHEAFAPKLDASDRILGADKAFKAEHFGLADLVHILTVTLRQQNIPARIVSGYYFDPEVTEPREGIHFWVETHVQDLGWIGLDPTTMMSPTDHYVRVAIGIDVLDAVPVRAGRPAGLGDSIETAITVSDLDG